MTYQVVYDPNEDCVHGCIEDQVDLVPAHEYTKEIIRQLSAHNCLRFLNDMRQASATLSTVAIYDLPAWIEEAGMDRSCKRALLVARDFNDYQFFETVSRNHGHLVAVFADPSQIAIFSDIAEASAWLGLTRAGPCFFLSAANRVRPDLSQDARHNSGFCPCGIESWRCRFATGPVRQHRVDRCACG